MTIGRASPSVMRFAVKAHTLKPTISWRNYFAACATLLRLICFREDRVSRLHRVDRRSAVMDLGIYAQQVIWPKCKVQI